MLKRDFEMLRGAYAKWLRSSMFTIESAYKTTCSQAKIDAYVKIWFEAKSLDSSNLKVINASRYTFTCGYTFFDVDGKEILVYHLPTRVLSIPVSDLHA